MPGRKPAEYFISILLLLFFTKPFACIAQKRVEPIPIKEAFQTLNFPLFIPISLSPDGRLLAYTLQDIRRKDQTAADGSPSYDLTRTGVPRDALYCDVWISDLVLGTATNLTNGRGNSWGPVWSPDGKSLAFYSDRSGAQSLWIWEPASRQMRQVSEAIVRTRTELMVPRWTPDSKKLVVKLLPEGLTLADAATMLTNPDASGTTPMPLEKEPGSTVILYSARVSKTIAEQEQERVRQNKNLEAYAIDLAVVDAGTGKIERLARRIIGDYWWISPDGANVALLVYKGLKSHAALQNLWDLTVISLRDRTQRTIAENIVTDPTIPVSWSRMEKCWPTLRVGRTFRTIVGLYRLVVASRAM